MRARLVYTGRVKTITLSADTGLIERARSEARRRRTTLNAEFRKWLEQYVPPPELSRQDYDALIASMRYAGIGDGPRLSHTEMNERR